MPLQHALGRCSAAIVTCSCPTYGAGMGLEDRDWFREEPSKAWKNRFRGSGGYGTSSSEHASRSQRATTIRAGRRVRLDGWFRRYALMPLAIVGAGWLLWDNRVAIDDAASSLALRLPAPNETAQAPQVVPGVPVVTDPNIVRLSARPGLDVPTRRVTKWSVHDPRFGQIEVYVPVGKTPRAALTVALAERGYQVVR